MTATDQRYTLSAETEAPLSAEDPRTAVRMISSVAHCAVEIVRAQRPAMSISRFVTPEILDMLERRAALTRRLRGLAPGSTSRPRTEQVLLRGVRSCVVNERVVEASAVVHEPGRARYLAMRWELRHSGWKVTVLELG